MARNPNGFARRRADREVCAWRLGSRSSRASRSSRSAREDPVERVFLEDVARRGLGRFVASRRRTASCAALCHSARTSSRRARVRRLRATTAARAAPRMLIGEELAVDRAVGRGARAAAATARGPPGPARLRHRDAAGPAPARRGCAPRRSTTSTCCCPPAPRRTSRSSGSTRCARDAEGFRWRDAQPDRGGALVALGRGRRDPLQGRGVGLDAGRGAAPAGLGRPVGAPPRLRRARARATSAGSCSSDVRPSASSCAPRTRRRSGSTRRSAWSTTLATGRSSSEPWRRSCSRGTAFAGSNSGRHRVLRDPGRGAHGSKASSRRAASACCWRRTESTLAATTEFARTRRHCGSPSAAAACRRSSSPS